MARIGLSVMILFSVLVGAISLRFLALGLDLAFPEMRTHIEFQSVAFAIHVMMSPIALIVGGFQFLPGLRARRRSMHRWLGRVYCVAVALGAVGGLILALSATDRPSAAIGFSALAVFWAGVTGVALWQILAGHVAAHRRWMIRSFALTFSAVTLRLMLPVFMFGLDWSYAEASNWVAWLCWVPNLLVVEWVFRRRAAPGLQAART